MAGFLGKQVDKNFLRKEFYQGFTAPMGLDTTLFTLSAVPLSQACIKLFVGTVSGGGQGRLVRQGVEYALSGRDIVWKSTTRFALIPDNSVSVVYIGKD